MTRLARLREVLSDGWAMVGLALLLFCLLEGVFRLVLLVREAGASPPVDPRARADTYRDLTWTQKYYDEFAASHKVRWAPYVYWRRKAYRREYIKVNASGIRRTWSPDNGGPEERAHLKVFMLGGSAMWGTGARDDFTIPSAVAKRLYRKGASAEVTNFGESGYVSTQEVMTLILELRKGNIPDVAVFYDGVNDTFAAYQQRVAGIPQNERNRVRELNLLQPENLAPLLRVALRESIGKLAMLRCFKASSPPHQSQAPPCARVAPAPEPPWSRPIDDHATLAQEVALAYEKNIELVELLAAQQHFEPIFYWQPTIFEKRHLSAYEESVRKEQTALQPFAAKVHERAAGEKGLARDGGRRFFDISSIFADITDPLFVDWSHGGESASDLLAERMTTDILAARAEAPPATS